MMTFNAGEAHCAILLRLSALYVGLRGAIRFGTIPHQPVFAAQNDCIHTFHSERVTVCKSSTASFWQALDNLLSWRNR